MSDLTKTPVSRRSALVLAGAAAAQAVLAQTPARGPMAELAQYEGADRQQRLIDGAKKEGNLSIYTSAQSDDMGALVAGYEKKFAADAAGAGG